MPSLVVLLEEQDWSLQPSIGPHISIVKMDCLKTFSVSDHPLYPNVYVHHPNGHVHLHPLPFTPTL
jgi:hypothetical protein